MVQAPIFHVNGDDPEACIRVARLAFEYRQAFNKDVVIDLVCYRRRGHNEGDDPSYTQPLMYDLIEQKRSVRKLYTESLIGRGDITIEEAEQVLRDYQQQLERVFTEVREATSTPDGVDDRPGLPGEEPPARPPPRSRGRRSSGSPTPTSAPPDGFTVHPKVLPQLQRRAAAITDGPIDWGTGEILAFGSLLMDGRPVRLAGQDSRRGTFVSAASRTIIDRHNADEWTPLSNLTEDQAQVLRLRLAALGVRRARASSTATPWPVPRRWCCGRRSSVTSSTARRPSSTSSSPPVRPSGASSRASCCCCRTATRVRVPTTPRPASSAS